MKHRITATILAVILLFALASPVLGSGDKDAGGVAQHQKSEYPYERRP